MTPEGGRKWGLVLKHKKGNGRKTVNFLRPALGWEKVWNGTVLKRWVER